ncbi:LacI family DNA-binding transcriptional regulator [Oceanobacillus sojae]|uniref:LacI family DNA-binding transcriptional regulator n=1 Tax=Oceanobacillus sojae TaxID=582851 RepID=UPI0021A72AAF|nr:LacI family DNA-binding transcriptional regulator [Oceanobacillus sojae]MCT1905240.1 LacI family DNA-binding transcriptional regulator [Oceanobacillus sojae]
MRPSRDDVAKEAGVSSATVSRVINNKGYISEGTRTKVNKAMDKLGYYPNELARSLSKNQSSLIGLIFPSLTNPFQIELISHLETLLSQENYKVLICNSQNNPENEKKYLEMLRRNQVEGVIVNSMNETFMEYNIPELHVVSIDRRINENIPVISCDNYNGGKQAVQKLIDENCRNILFIGGTNNKRLIDLDADKRYRAYLDLLDQYKIPPLTLDLDFTLSYAEKYEKIKAFLSQNTFIDGIFSDDTSAVIALNIANDLDISIPEDFKIVGFDGATLTLHQVPELTTVQQPIKKIAELSAQTLLSVINDKEVQSITDLPTKLRLGTTC